MVDGRKVLAEWLLEGERKESKQMLRYLIAGFAGLVLMGCTTPSGPTPSPSPPVATATPTSPTPSMPSPTPTPTLNAKQTAGVKVVKAYFATTAKIGANPAKFTRNQMAFMLIETLGGDMIKGNLDSFLYLKKRGYHEEGELVLAKIAVDKVGNYGGGDVMTVTVCQDQTRHRIVDRSGKVVQSEQAERPPFLEREYTVRKPPSEKKFRIFGTQPTHRECGR